MRTWQSTLLTLAHKHPHACTHALTHSHMHTNTQPSSGYDGINKSQPCTSLQILITSRNSTVRCIVSYWIIQWLLKWLELGNCDPSMQHVSSSFAATLLLYCFSCNQFERGDTRKYQLLLRSNNKPTTTMLTERITNVFVRVIRYILFTRPYDVTC